MMKAFLYKSLSVVVISLLQLPCLSAQYSAEKVITESFAASSETELSLENKYGDVIIAGWEKDSVKVVVEIQVKKKSYSDAEDLLDRIIPQFSSFGSYLTITTEIQERGDSFFSRLFNEINPIDFDKSDVDIKYEIHVPKSMSMELTNDFGDLVITNWSGKLKTRLKHGDLKVTDELTDANLKVSFGKINARVIQSAFINLRNGKLNLHECKELNLISHGSDIELGQIDFLDIESNKDEVMIDEVNRIKAEVRYSTFFIDRIAKEMYFDLSLADVRVSSITNTDAIIDITENNSEVDLNITGLSLAMNADMEGGTLRLPASTSDLDTQVLDEKNKVRKVSASYGSGAKGKFVLNGKKGYVILREL